MFDWQLSARAFDGRAAGPEVLHCWAFGNIDFVPSAAFVIVISVVIAVDAFLVFYVFQLDSYPNSGKQQQQRRFKLGEHVGGGWFYGCVWDPCWACVDLGWECFLVIHGLYTLLLLSTFAYLEVCRFRSHVVSRRSLKV